ncbi:hypothetical protein TcasGA2_TC031469 [Tribolium castaneum]|uniref:Uncharacterized protein n=1 Tax=Tribolium castaneum TaxID=7070 RepID=A0A139WPJ3_TRICA|nr:hypothetical protein TcasGA2_TC031469 [Tribolium castaneum]
MVKTSINMRRTRINSPAVWAEAGSVSGHLTEEDVQIRTFVGKDI